jgi:hypothetical protein
MNGIRGSEEGHVWAPAMYQKVKLVYIGHTLCLECRKGTKCNPKNYFAVS